MTPDPQNLLEAPRGRSRVPLGIVRSTHRVPAADATGLSLHVRHASPASSPRGTVVLVHGATLASGLWDIAVPGYSVLQALADAGFSAWAPDIRGYARSDRLAQPTAPYAGLHEAMADIAATVRHAQHHDRAARVLLVGGSWGSITAATYAGAHPDQLLGLALMAPLYATRNTMWLADLTEPGAPHRLCATLGATRGVRREDLLRRWDSEITQADKSLRRDSAVIDALLADALQAEPAPLGDAFSVPNGTLCDLFEVFSGRPLADPALLTMPLLLVRGEHDATATATDAQALFEQAASTDKQWLTIGDAGHFICAERAAPAFQQALIGFARHCTPRGRAGGSVPRNP